MLSGITAHCDPSFYGDLRCEISVFVQSSGDVHAEPNREIHVSDLRELSCKFLSDNNIKQCRGRGRRRRLPFRSKGRDARGPPLVLPYRSSQQPPLLVSQRRRRKAGAKRAVECVSLEFVSREFVSRAEAGFAKTRT